MNPVERIVRSGVVPVVELPSLDAASPLLDALLAGGLDTAEITLRTEVGPRAIARLRTTHPDALIGAGTVRSLEDVRRVVDAGAQFVVSPSTNADLIDLCRSLDVVAIPGVCTPTEIDVAVRAGAELVKFFPAEAMGGLTFLRALAGPFAEVRFVPTGGIDASNLADYLRLPQVAACGGSWMVAKRLILERRFGEITELAREAKGIVEEVRPHA